MYDSLGLTSRLDGFQRAHKQEVEFRLFRMYRNKVSWSPMTTNNLALFYGQDIQERDMFVKTIAKQSRKFSKSVNLSFIDIAGTATTLTGSLTDKERENFTYTPATGLVGAILGQLAVFRDDVRRKTRELRVIEITNRKLSIVFLNLSQENVNEIKATPQLRTVFKDLLLDSSRERLYIIPLCENAESFPQEILQELEWVAYLGGANAMHCRNMHPDMKDGLYSLRQIVTGMLYATTYRRLVTIHPIEFTPSEWHLQREAQTKKENEAFGQFLNALDDGKIS